MSDRAERHMEQRRAEENALGSPPKANNGLHLSHEHAVITRDMPDPWVIHQAYGERLISGLSEIKPDS